MRVKRPALVRVTAPVTLWRVMLCDVPTTKLCAASRRSRINRVAYHSIVPADPVCCRTFVHLTSVEAAVTPCTSVKELLSVERTWMFSSVGDTHPFRRTMGRPARLIESATR